ncbi:hypothetical protein GBAR_LOCUS3012 [Geodia barretti]|uniref:Ig-like domain-containing protein n=1 Tax=Geodia barretti TaxID=519541 RepID=A0AA35R3A4_GEOBA|nr:hypothetical protein GBAR_LOCUS3012 [Geodia barretti]
MGCTTAASLNHPVALLSFGMIVASNEYEQGQVITSSLVDGSACVGEDVTLTCSVLGTGRLTWVIGSNDNTILFNLADYSSLTTQTDSTGQFTASLTNYSRDQQYSFLGDLTSTLHTQVNPSLTDYPIKILCFNGISNNISVPSYIKISGLPSPDIISGVWNISVFTGSWVGESTG